MRAKGTEGYQGVFAPSNLEEATEPGSQSEQKEEPQEETVESPGKSQFQNIFDPANLQQQSGSENTN